MIEWSGHTSALESIAYLLLDNKLEKSSITIDNPSDENSKLDLEIGIMKNCHKDIQIINNTPYITCEFFVTGNIESSGKKFDYTKSENILKVEKSAEKYLKTLITDYLYKISREYNSDIFNFENMYTKKCLTNKELEAIHFKDIYKDSVFDVTVNVDIGSSNLFEKE